MNEMLSAKKNSSSMRLDLFFTDLDMAATFINVARTSTNPRAVERNYDYARKVYDVVVDFVPRLNPSDEQLESINEKLSAIRLQLGAMEENFESAPGYVAH